VWGPLAGPGATGDLGDYLRNERLARCVSLDMVEARTKISRHLLEDLERNNLKSWPRERFYKEHFLRAYAGAVGLDPRQVVDRFRLEFPIPDAAHTTVETPKRSQSAWLTVAGLFAAALVIGLAFLNRQQPTSTPEAQALDDESAGTAGMDLASAQAPDAAPAARSRAVSISSVVSEPVSEVPAPPDAVEEIEGELMITSTPPGARVTVNGIGRGDTPVSVRFLPPGSYTVRFIGSGHQIVERHVTVTPSRPRVSVTATLRPDAESTSE
jgi:cytoskeletal protein RodZ